MATPTPQTQLGSTTAAASGETGGAGSTVMGSGPGSAPATGGAMGAAGSIPGTGAGVATGGIPADGATRGVVGSRGAQATGATAGTVTPPAGLGTAGERPVGVTGTVPAGPAVETTGRVDTAPAQPAEPLRQTEQQPASGPQMQQGMTSGDRVAPTIGATADGRPADRVDPVVRGDTAAAAQEGASTFAGTAGMRGTSPTGSTTAVVPGGIQHPQIGQPAAGDMVAPQQDPAARETSGVAAPARGTHEAPATPAAAVPAQPGAAGAATGAGHTDAQPQRTPQQGVAGAPQGAAVTGTQRELTEREERRAMPVPGQNNDHSSPQVGTAPTDARPAEPAGQAQPAGQSR